MYCEREIVCALNVHKQHITSRFHVENCPEYDHMQNCEIQNTLPLSAFVAGMYCDSLACDDFKTIRLLLTDCTCHTQFTLL